MARCAAANQRMEDTIARLTLEDALYKRQMDAEDTLTRLATIDENHWQESLAAASTAARIELEVVSRVEAAKLRAHDARTKVYGRDLGPIAAMEERPGSIGTLVDLILQFNDLFSLILPSLTLRASRGLACCCFQLRTLLTPTLRAPTLDVGPHDATWENAVFVARLPGLQTLRIDGEHFLPEVDVGRVRARPRLLIGQMGATAALFVGALIADGNLRLHLSNGNSMLDFEPLRVARGHGVLAVPNSIADACALLGPLSRNQALLSWPFNGRFDIDQCREAILRAETEKDISSYSTDDMEFLMWAGAAKDALPLLWAEYDEMQKKADREPVAEADKVSHKATGKAVGKSKSKQTQEDRDSRQQKREEQNRQMQEEMRKQDAMTDQLLSDLWLTP